MCVAVTANHTAGIKKMVQAGTDVNKHFDNVTLAQFFFV